MVCLTLNSLLSRASNIVSDNKTEYTKEMFLTDFPQFSKKVIDEETKEETIVPLVPESILTMFINMANDAIQEERWFTQWRYGMGLYIAHYSVLYLQTYEEPTEKDNTNKVVANAKVYGAVASGSHGDQSIAYDNSAVTQDTVSYGTWNATVYGKQLVTIAKLLGKGGAFII